MPTFRDHALSCCRRWRVLEDHLRAGIDQDGFSGRLEKAEAWPILPRQRAAELDVARERGVLDTGDERLVGLLALLVAGEISEIGRGRKDHVDPRHRRDLLRIGDALRRLDHDHHHHVVVGGLAVIVAPELAVLAAPLAAPPEWRILRPLHRAFGLLDGIDGGTMTPMAPMSVA